MFMEVMRMGEIIKNKIVEREYVMWMLFKNNEKYSDN